MEGTFLVQAIHTENQVYMVANISTFLITQQNLVSGAANSDQKTFSAPLMIPGTPTLATKLARSS